MFILLFFIIPIILAKNNSILIYTTLDETLVPETTRTILDPIEMSYLVFPLTQPISPLNTLIIRDIYHWITACHYTDNRFFPSVMNRIEPEIFEKMLPISSISYRQQKNCTWLEFIVGKTDLILLPKVKRIKKWCCIT